MQLIQFIMAFGSALRNDQRGVTAIEYGILAAGVAVLIGMLVSSDGTFHTTLTALFFFFFNQLPQAQSK